MLAVLSRLIWLLAVNGCSCTDAEDGKGTRESRYLKGVNGYSAFSYGKLGIHMVWRFQALSCSLGYAQRSTSEDSRRLRKVCDGDLMSAPRSSLGTRSPPCGLGNGGGNVSYQRSGDNLEAALWECPVECSKRPVSLASPLMPRTRASSDCASFCNQWMLPGCAYRHTYTEPLLLLFRCFIVHKKM